MCSTLKSRFSFPYISIVFLNVFPVVFQSQVFWGLVSPMQDPKIGVLNVELESLASQGEVLYH